MPGKTTPSALSSRARATKAFRGRAKPAWWNIIILTRSSARRETEAYRQTLMTASSDGTTVTTAQDKDGNTFAVRAVEGDSYALAYPVSDNGDGTVSLGAPVQRSMSDFDKGSMASAPLETYLQGLSARQRAQGQAEDAAAREQDMAASLPPIRADRPMQAVRPVTYFTTDMKKEKAAVEGSRIEAVADVPEGTAADAPVRVVVTAPNGKAEPGVMTYGQLQGMLADGSALESGPVRRDPEHRVAVSGASQGQQPLQNPQPSPQSAGVPGSQAEQNKQAEYKDTVGGSPVALSYLLEGGKGNIGSSGYFLHGLSAAFPALTEKIESIRNKYLSEINPSPMEYAASGHPSIEEIRDLIRSVYGEEGVGIYEELLRNADGFIPSEGIELGRRIESLSPLVPAQPGEVAQGGEAAVPAAQAVQATAQPSENRDGLIGRSLTEAEAEALISSMEANAETAPEMELTPENWVAEFGENGEVDTPIGKVKMGENQLAKMFLKKRVDEFGMVKPTLTKPDVILEEASQAKEGQTAERPSSYLFVKTFNRGGEKIKFYASVTVSKDGMEVVISNHYMERNALEKKMEDDGIVYVKDSVLPIGSDRHLAENPQEGSPDLLPTRGSSESETKGSADSGEKQSLGEKIAAAEEETNANPTEGQKQAGNYKKGHVRIGQFDISIENPKGSVRRGVDANGKAWEHTMQNSYGYIRGTEGVDGDHIDVFLSDKIDDWNGSRAFVIDQYNEDGTFDEHKVMLGFNEQEDAWNAYLVNYEDGWADGRRLVITPVNIEKFENWIASSHRKTKPFAEYNGVNKVQIPLDEEGSPMYEQAPVQATWDDLMARNGRDEGKVRYFAQEMKAVKDRELKAERKKKPKGKNAAELQRAMDEQQSKIGRLEQESSYWDTVLSMSYRAGEAAATEGARARQAEAGRKREASERGFPAIQARWKSARKEEGMTPEGRKARLEERHRQRQEAETEARERLAGLGAQDNGEPDYHRSGERGAEAPTEAEAELRDAIVGRLRASGIEVVTDSEAGQRVLDEANGKNVMLNARKKKSLETDSVPQEEHQRTVISSDDGAKVLNNLDDLIKEYENSVHTKEKTFIGNAAKALGAKRYGSKSEYATFETVNGNEVTIRLSDHNASVERMDKAGRDNAISIVVTPKPNSGILDDGNAHIVEFYYNAIRLRRAEGKPLVEILKSIKQALYSGEFKDTTGLAEVKVVNADRIRYHRGYHGSGADFEAFDHVRFFRTANGEAYGFTVGGKIYLDPRIAKADTPIHEYAHLWAEALRKADPEEWRNIVGLMKDSPVWEEVKERYPELGTEDEIADEVLATYSGRRGAERLREARRKHPGKDFGEALGAIEAMNRVREALQRFWSAVADFLHINYRNAEEVADRVMRDLLEGVNPMKEASDTDLFKGVTAEVREEMEAIRSKAQADGTWMKAPNGNPTNLTERQWLQVRTKAFKDWFGDWEKANLFNRANIAWRDKDSKGKVVVSLSGNAKSRFDELLGTDVKQFVITDDAIRHIKNKHGQNEESRGQRNLTPEDIVVIPYLVNNFDTMALNPSENDRMGNRAVEIRKRINGVSVVATIERGKNKEFLVTSYQFLKSDALDASKETPGLNVRNDSDIANVKKEIEAIKKAVSNSSKVVDENGEPLVVYHGTPLRRDQITPNRGWQRDGTYVRQKAPFHTFKGGEYSGMIFTSVEAAKARSIAEKRALSIPDNADGTEQWTEEGYVYDLFVNVKNPFVPQRDAEGILSSMGANIPTLSFYGGEGESVPLDVAKEILESGNSWIVTETPQFIEKVRESGYDGLYGKDEGVDYIACFAPNQLKDAYENNGTFSAMNDDIRFRQQGGRGEATDMESKRAAVEALGRKLNVEVVFEDEASLRKQPRQYRTASGWFDRAQWRKDGRRVIHVNLSNTGDAHEAEMTVLHEAVGHMGLRELLGAENYDPFLDMVHGIIPEAQAGRLRALVFKGHPDLARRVGEGNADGKDRETAEAELRRVMADEWLAELAEVGGEPGVWEQIVESFRMLLRRLGFELSLSESDIRALLFESRRNLESSRLPGEAERIREQQEEFREAARLDRIMEADMADMEADAGSEASSFRQGGGASARPTRSQRRQAERMFRDDKIISAGKEREWTSRQRFRHGMANLQEFFNDSVRLRYLGNHIRRMGGRVSSATDLYELATTVPAKEQYRSERFELSCGRPLVSCVREILQRTGKKVRDLELYMIAKHGPERNRWMYNRKKLGELADDMAYEVRNESGITRPLGEAAKNRIIASIMKEDGGKDSYMDAAVARKMAADIYEALSQSHAASMTQEAMKAQGKGLSLPKDNARILTQEDLDGIAEKTQSSLLERAEKDTDTDKDFSGLSDFAKTTGTNPENYVARFEEEVESAVPGGIDSFWEHLNAVTDFTLQTRLECGLMSEEAYQAVKDMDWSHYVPLRSWDARNPLSDDYMETDYKQREDSQAKVFHVSAMRLETARAEVGTYVEKLFGEEALVDEDSRPEIILIANKEDVADLQ